MDMGARAFEAGYAMLPAARCQVRIDGKTVIARALSVGLQHGTTPTDMGVGQAVDGNVRFLAADEPREIKVDEPIEIKRAHDAAFVPVRVMSRVQIGGAVRLSLEAEFQA